MKKVTFIFIVMISVISAISMTSSTKAAPVRWNYEIHPKHFKPLFENESFSIAFESIKNTTFINKQNEIQVIPLAYNEFIKWLNKGLVKMNEQPFDSKKIKMYWHRDTKDSNKLRGFHVKQGNRIFCLPCQFKKGDRLVFGELVRKDVFLTNAGEEPVYQNRVKKKKIIRTRKTFKDLSNKFEIQIMKGEYKIASKRKESGNLFSTLNCFYQLRLHYKGKKIPEFPQMSFSNETTQAFIGLVDEKEVILYMDDRIQRYTYRGKLDEEKLTEYSLIVPSDEYVRSFFWFAPGLKVAPSFNFVKKKAAVDLGDGKRASGKRYHTKLDQKINDLLDLYRNDAFFVAPEEYCHYIQSCFNADNTSEIGIAEKVKSWHQKDCKDVLTLDELKKENIRVKEKNKNIMKRK